MPGSRAPQDKTAAFSQPSRHRRHGSSRAAAVGAEWRLASFAELIGTAVSNAMAHSELIASRARIVATSDAARQRVTRDLHDGAQQRFANAIINLQLAQQKWSSAPQQAKELLDRALAKPRPAWENSGKSQPASTQPS